MQITKKGYKKLFLAYAFVFFVLGTLVLLYVLYQNSEKYKGITTIFSMAFIVGGA